MTLVHLTMDQLLAVRDRQGTTAAHGHLDGCPECRGELEQLHQRAAALRALPSLNAPRDRWDAVRTAALAGRRRRRVRIAGWVGVGAAAALVVALGVGRDLGSSGPPSDVTELMDRAERIEEALRRFEPERRVLSGRVAGAVAALEDEIASVDRRLARAREFELGRERIAALWRERVQLMDALLTVRATRATYVGF